MGLETYGNVQPVTWDNYFLSHHEVLKRHGVVNTVEINPSKVEEIGHIVNIKVEDVDSNEGT